MNNIGLIIFDLDGTFYDLNDVVSMNYQMQVDFYSLYAGLSVEETIHVFEKNNIYPKITEKSKSATEFFAKNGVLISRWNKYREDNFRVDSIRKEKAVSSEILDNYKQLGYPMVLLSSNSLNNIRKILSHLKVSESLFDEIICSDTKHGKEEFSKLEEMRLISERREIDPRSLFSIGDRKRTDVDPVLMLGGHGVVVCGADALGRLYSDIMQNSICDCDLYSYY